MIGLAIPPAFTHKFALSAGTLWSRPWSRSDLAVAPGAETYLDNRVAASLGKIVGLGQLLVRWMWRTQTLIEDGPIGGGRGVQVRVGNTQNSDVGTDAADNHSLPDRIANAEQSGSYDPECRPTEAQYAAFLAAFDHFNSVLFAGRLPSVLLTFAKHGKAIGFFCADRWGKTPDGQQLGEISLCPDYLRSRDARDSASTLVHEMVHLWQHAHGKPSRRGYHNAEWAKEMDRVGLAPSDTGEPGGQRTGQRMTHYIVEEGPFDKAFTALGSEWMLPFLAGDGRLIGKGKPKRKLDRSKLKHMCGCGQAAWGKAGLRLMCADCHGNLLPVEGEVE
jgi:hypothetical protein